MEDDPGLRRLCVLILSRLRHRVDASPDGLAAWERLCLGNYDLLVTDNEMPRLSGIGLLRRVRAAGLPLPVLMVSASVPEESLRLEPRLQPDVILKKPFDIESLVMAVESAVRLSPFGRRGTVDEGMLGEHPIQQTSASR